MKSNDLTTAEIKYLINHARENRLSSAILAKHPVQKWAKEHKEELERMEALIEKLEALLDKAQEAEIAAIMAEADCAKMEAGEVS